MSRKLILEELNLRQAAKVKAAGVVAALRKELFDKQLAFLDDKSLYKAALCTRRAGKTSMWARYCTIEAIKHERVLIRVWGISRLRVKQLLWDEFKTTHARHGLKTTTNETELTIRFANGSEIRLLGADKDKEVQKKRGDKTWMEVVLESQLFGPILKGLVEDVADPCLMDERQRGGGIFCLEGTPGPVCAGYWYDVTGRDDASARWQSVGGKNGAGAGWSCHRWSVLDNPHMPHARLELADMKLRRRWADDNPTYLREWRALWVNDVGALFYKFHEKRNLYDPTKVEPWGVGWEHVLGWDLGFRDDMALVVWAWHPSYSNLYEAFSWKKPGALAHEVMEQIEALEDKGFNFVKKVADTGGGGKMYVEEVMSRYSQVFEAAKKTEKYEHARLLNDDLLTGHVLLRPGSPLAEELSTLPTDPDWPDPEKPEKPPTEDPRFPNHCFVAGTLVLTKRGQVPIEQIVVGDLVLTRAGWRTVEAAACTGVRQVITRLGVTGTPDHPIWTESGWRQLDEVRSTDTVVYACQASASNGTGSGGTGTLSQSAEATGCISSAPWVSGASNGFTGPSGSTIEELSREGITFITRTATPATTASKTWNASQAGSTSQNTPASGTSQTQVGGFAAWKQRARQLLRGTRATRGGSGTARTESVWQRLRRSFLLSAWYVAQFFNPRGAHWCAATSVSLDSGAPPARTTSSTSAPSVEACTPPASTANRSTAPEPARYAIVYDLSVSGVHEFFANGLLVHNCADAGLYAYRAAWHFLHIDVKPKPDKGSAAYYDELESVILQKLESPNERPWWEPDDDTIDSFNSFD